MSVVIGRRLTDLSATLGNWPAFAILMLLCGLFFGYLVPKAKAPIFKQAAPGLPHKVLDEYFPSWTAAIANDFFAAIGTDGCAAYRRFYLILDFWFPGTIASLTLASLLLIAFPPHAGLAWLCLIAVPSWLFDAAENITHFQMAGSYPALSPIAIKIGPIFTRAKWICAILPLPIATAGLALQICCHKP